MVRPIRIPQAETGLGGPTRLPSIAAQTAPARAAGQLGLQAAGAVGGFVREHVDRKDNLTFVRDQARSHATLTAALAGADEKLGDYVRSGEYTEEGYAALREKLYGDAYASAMEGVTHPQVRARLEGQREGNVGADLTAEFEQNDLEIDILAGEQAADAAIGFIGEVGSEFAPLYVTEAAQVFDLLQTERPELREHLQRQRRRVFQAAQTEYLKDGAKGELRFTIALSEGTFDALGMDVVGPTARKAAERRSDLLAEMAEDSILDDNYGVLTEKGGRFPGYSNVPETTELRALKEDAQGLPEHERDQLVRALDVLIDRRERRAAAMETVEAFHGEQLGAIPLVQNPEIRAAYDQHFRESIVPFFLGNPEVPREEKTAFLQRNLLGLGVVPQSMQEFVQQVVRNANPDPETFRAIGEAFAVVEGVPVPGAKAPPSGQSLSAKLDMNWISKQERELLSFVARNAGEGPGASALALQKGLEFQEATRSGGGGSSRALSATADSKAAREAEKADEALRERVSVVYDAPVDVIGDHMLGRIRELTLAEAHRLVNIPGTGMSEDEALQAAQDEAIRQVLDSDPPVRLHDRVFMSGPINALLENGKYTPQMIEMEIEDGFRVAGIDPGEGDWMDRYVLIQEAGMDPTDFRILIRGDDETPWRFLEDQDGMQAIIRIDGETSVHTEMTEGLKLAGMEHLQKHTQSSQPGKAERVMDDLVSATFLTREDFMGRYVASFEPSSRGMPETVASGIRRSLESGAARARRNALTSRVPEGAPIWEVRPGLREKWQAEYDAKVKDLTPREMFEIVPGVPVMNRAGYRPDDLHNLATKAADKAIHTELRREFQGATVDQFMRFLESGLYPAESGVDLPPLRQPEPGGLDLPEIQLEDAFSPAEILRERGGQ